MRGIFQKPSKRAIWNILGLHAVLTTYFCPFWVMLVLLAACFCQRATTISAY